MGERDIKWGLIDNEDARLKIDDNRYINFYREENIFTFKMTEDGEDIYQHRFIVNESDNIYIEPSYPDLPIVVRSSTDLTILPLATFTAYVEVPLVLTIFAGTGKKRERLYEISLKQLSKSFLGEAESGELSYSMESPLFCDYKKYNICNSSVYCRFSIKNMTQSKMVFERMILRVPNFSLYSGDNTYFSNKQVITYVGKDVNNSMTIQKHSPNTGVNTTFISPPREQIDKSLLKKSFYFLKNIYNYQ